MNWSMRMFDPILAEGFSRGVALRKSGGETYAVGT
jgi:hypothetical protein